VLPPLPLPQVLNCNTYDVGLHAAVDLGAEKLLVVHLDDVQALQLPQWLSLSAAKGMLLQGAGARWGLALRRPPAAIHIAHSCLPLRTAAAFALETSRTQLCERTACLDPSFLQHGSLC
jgi:hypothetical protein